MLLNVTDVNDYSVNCLHYRANLDVNGTRLYTIANLHAINILKPRRNDKISQTTFSNVFSWQKMFEIL